MGRCSDFLETQLDVDNCLEIKDFANYQVGCEKLRLAAERFAGKAFDKVHIFYILLFLITKIQKILIFSSSSLQIRDLEEHQQKNSLI